MLLCSWRLIIGRFAAVIVDATLRKYRQKAQDASPAEQQ